MTECERNISAQHVFEDRQNNVDRVQNSVNFNPHRQMCVCVCEFTRYQDINKKLTEHTTHLCQCGCARQRSFPHAQPEMFDKTHRSYSNLFTFTIRATEFAIS